MSTRSLVIWGATGQARVLLEFLVEKGWRVIAIVDRDPAVRSPVPDASVCRNSAELKLFLENTELSGGEAAFCAAIGGGHGRDRIAIHDELSALGLDAVTAVHPTAYIARNALLGPGCQVLAGAVVGADARLGRQVIINTSASIDHDCQIADGCHVGPGAHLAGEVMLQENVFVGTGASILPRIRIGEDTCVGAGAVVIRNLPNGVVAVGNPARIIKRR